MERVFIESQLDGNTLPKVRVVLGDTHEFTWYMRGELGGYILDDDEEQVDIEVAGVTLNIYSAEGSLAHTTTGFSLDGGERAKLATIIEFGSEGDIEAEGNYSGSLAVEFVSGVIRTWQFELEVLSDPRS